MLPDSPFTYVQLSIQPGLHRFLLLSIPRWCLCWWWWLVLRNAVHWAVCLLYCPVSCYNESHLPVLPGQWGMWHIWKLVSSFGVRLRNILLLVLTANKTFYSSLYLHMYSLVLCLVVACFWLPRDIYCIFGSPPPSISLAWIAWKAF